MWLPMKRWNNHPRIENVSQMDNIWFVIHIALFLARLEEENNKLVDKEFLIKKILFDWINRLILSDINSETKQYIQKFDKEIFKKLEQKAFDYIMSYDCLDYIKDDIKNTVDNSTKTLENQIIKASKRYAAFCECSVNSKIYPEAYTSTINDMLNDFEKQRKSLLSLDLLLENSNYKTYLNQIRRLSHSFRWNQQNRSFPISVMSHFVITTYIVYILWIIENNNWANYDILNLMFRTMYHDIPEAITWDIISPTKKAIDWFEEILEKVEKQMIEDQLFVYISKEYADFLTPYVLQPFEWVEWKICKYADIISALFEAKVEANNGNMWFIDIYTKIKKVVNKYWLKSTDYILKYWLDSFTEQTTDINL